MSEPRVRAEGWYWVREVGPDGRRYAWQIGQWIPDNLGEVAQPHWIVGGIAYADDRDFEIGPRIEPPDCWLLKSLAMARVEHEAVGPLARSRLYLGDILLRAEYRHRLGAPALLDDLAERINALIDARVAELLAGNNRDATALTPDVAPRGPECPDG